MGWFQQKVPGGTELRKRKKEGEETDIILFQLKYIKNK